MKTMSETIVFFGSGPVAAKSLELLAQNFSIEAVITKPQPPHHKEPFPVLVVTEKLGIKTLTPNSKAELSEVFNSKPVQSRLGVVIDYGFIINQDVIDYFPLGIINSHFSLLPEWRGADPISFALLSGQKQTGVSLMLITAGMDEGPLLSQTPFDISENLTTPELTEALIDVSNQSLKTILPLYVPGEVLAAPQESTTIARSKEPTYSRKLTKADGLIDWCKTAEQIEREIRAFIEWPKSRTTLAGKEVILIRAYVVPCTDPEAKPGDVSVVPKANAMAVATGNGSLRIECLKPVGKREMSTREFLAGHRHLL
ncbi:methionyl-tRNA formyltransferase [Candidatus Saccharibacteria bacterium]|nr:methionyl-tRNA formyltransferase [Candidatus Saccharibacteria bacterium]